MKLEIEKEVEIKTQNNKQNQPSNLFIITDDDKVIPLQIEIEKETKVDD